MMYYCDMSTDKSGISIKALVWAMETKKKWTPAILSRKAEVNKSTISLLINGKEPGISATIVARLARALEVSTDFLMGFTENPEQKTEMDLAIAEIIAIAKSLPEFRQRDLLLVAKAYQEAGDPTAEMMERIYEEVEKIGGEAMRKKLSASLDSLRSTGTSLGGKRRGRRSAQKGSEEAESK